jgi:hypothetical protein
MTRAQFLAAVLAVCAGPGVSATSVAQVSRASETAGYAPSPPFWAVTGVRSSDVLNLRDMPAAESKSLARIPANASGLKNLGCRNNVPSLEQWMRMSKAERDRGPTQWCRVEYRGKQGWVAGRYLKKDETAGRAQ